MTHDEAIKKAREALKEIESGAGRREDVSGIIPTMAIIARRGVAALDSLDESSVEERQSIVTYRPEDQDEVSLRNGCVKLLVTDKQYPARWYHIMVDADRYKEYLTEESKPLSTAMENCHSPKYHILDNMLGGGKS